MTASILVFRVCVCVCLRLFRLLIASMCVFVSVRLRVGVIIGASGVFWGVSYCVWWMCLGGGGSEDRTSLRGVAVNP